MKPPTSGLGFGSMLAMGASIAGFGYLAYSIRDLNRNKMAYMAQG